MKISLQPGDVICITSDNYLQISRKGKWLRLNGVESIRSSFKNARRIVQVIAWTHSLQIFEEEKKSAMTKFTLS